METIYDEGIHEHLRGHGVTQADLDGRTEIRQLHLVLHWHGLYGTSGRHSHPPQDGDAELLRHVGQHLVGFAK